MFCEIADAWASIAVSNCASIWFLARSAVKSVSWMLEREASIFWVWLVRLDMVKAKRWIVEPTFAWFAWYQPLSLDYQRESLHSENMISIAMIPLMLKRL